jgi:hypothetical protein
MSGAVSFPLQLIEVKLVAKASSWEKIGLSAAISDAIAERLFAAQPEG